MFNDLIATAARFNFKTTTRALRPIFYAFKGKKAHARRFKRKKARNLFFAGFDVKSYK